MTTSPVPSYTQYEWVDLACKHGVDPTEVNVWTVGHARATAAQARLLALEHGTAPVVEGAASPTPALSVVSDPTPAPRTWQSLYADTPRDVLTHFSDRTRRSIVDDSDAGRRRSGRREEDGVQSIPINRSWLLAAHLRLANNDTGLVVVRPDVLAAASGLSLRTLQAEYREGTNHWLSPWVTRIYPVADEFRDIEGEVIWKFQVTPGSSRNSLHTPYWWIWVEPEDGATGADRVMRRTAPVKTTSRRGGIQPAVSESPLNPSSPALLVMWALQHVGDGFTHVEGKGVAYLTAVTGLSRSSVKRGLRDAVAWGWLARIRGVNVKGEARGAAVNDVRLRYDDALGEGIPGEHLW